VNVPANLDGWNLKVVADLCRVGLPESDRHDFKAVLPGAEAVTKLCCAFANTFGGFLVLGVGEESDHVSFKIVGVDVHTEWHARLMGKIRADPDITVLGPKVIELAGAESALYVFYIPQSPRRPHLPTPASERVFSPALTRCQ
jgi:predicted HTH transcriptional regulator